MTDKTFKPGWLKYAYGLVAAPIVAASIFGYSRSDWPEQKTEFSTSHSTTERDANMILGNPEEEYPHLPVGVTEKNLFSEAIRSGNREAAKLLYEADLGTIEGDAIAKGPRLPAGAMELNST